LAELSRSSGSSIRIDHIRESCHEQLRRFRLDRLDHLERQRDWRVLLRRLAAKHPWAEAVTVAGWVTTTHNASSPNSHLLGWVMAGPLVRAIRGTRILWGRSSWVCSIHDRGTDRTSYQQDGQSRGISRSAHAEFASLPQNEKAASACWASDPPRPSSLRLKKIKRTL